MGCRLVGRPFSGCQFVDAELAVCPRQGLAELAVLSPKSRYVLMSQFEAVSKRLRTGTTIRGCTGRACCAAVVPELFALVTQFGLGVKPRLRPARSSVCSWRSLAT